MAGWARGGCVCGREGMHRSFLRGVGVEVGFDQNWAIGTSVFLGVVLSW